VGEAGTVIAVVVGTAGVGKTAAAMYWAHQAALRFPDGQLYVDLRGFDHEGSPLAATDAVRGFLEALGLPPGQVPISQHAQFGMYRSLLAGRRLLVVLDNAADAEQVRPLLPGSPTCMVVVTSRNEMTGLVTAGAHPIVLDLFTTVEARQLLASRLGDDRVAAEPAAVDEIIARCARLPLALAVVTAHAATHPRFALTAVAGQLCTAGGGLEAFTDDEPAADVRTIFSWSYRALTAPAARLFRLMTAHPGPDFTATSAASLTGEPLARVRQQLVELTHAHLITEHRLGRYVAHDLLRAYAAELADVHDTPADRRAAIHRVLDHYLHTAHTAALLLEPYRHPIELPAARPGTAAEPLVDHGEALAWGTAERPVLLAAIRQAAGAGFDVHAWQLAWSVATSLQRQGHWHDLVATQRTALEAASRLDDRAGQAHTHRGLARAYIWLGRYDDASAHLWHAIELHRELGDHIGQAHAHRGLARVLGLLDRHQEALDHTRQALRLYRTIGNRAGQANALNAIGWYQARHGQHLQALEHCRRALTLQQAIADRHGEALTWDSLGFVHHNLGDHQQAVACYGRALELYHEVADRYEEAATLARLGETHDAAGDRHAAAQAWQHAMDILTEFSHPAADRLRTRMRDLIGATPDQ
jgi:tetratricopeptide (TPR) repeat protein